MTLSAAKVGGWSLGELLTHTQVNHLQSELLKAIDGQGGGSYTLGGTLTLAGADIRFDDDVHFRNTSNLIFDSGADLFIESGAIQRVRGTGQLQIENGALLSVESGGEVLVDELDALLANGASLSEYMKLLPAGYLNPEGSTGWQWDAVIGEWVQQTVASFPPRVAWVFYLDDDDEIDAITVNLDGNAYGTSAHAGMPATKPAVFVYALGTAGGQTALASLVDPVASVGTYEGPHGVLLDATSCPGDFPIVGTGTNSIVIEVRGEFGTNSLANYLSIGGIRVERTVNKLRAGTRAGH